MDYYFITDFTMIVYLITFFLNAISFNDDS